MLFNRACSSRLLPIVGVVAILGELVIAPGVATAKSPSRAPDDLTCGTVITTPGTYTISGTLNCTGPGDGIDISTSNVTIQFTNSGYLMCGGCPQSGGTETGIKIYDAAGGPRSNVNILGPGTIYGWPFGVSYLGSRTRRLVR